MDLVRLDTIEVGVIYIRADALFSLNSAPPAEDTKRKRTMIRFLLAGFNFTDVTVENDIDEIAALFESAVPEVMVRRID